MADNSSSSGITLLGRRFSWPDLFVWLAGNGIGGPLCGAGAKTLLDGNIGSAAIGFVVGLPLMAIGWSFPFVKDKLGQALKDWLTTVSGVAIPFLVIVAFLYVVGPLIYRNAIVPPPTVEEIAQAVVRRVPPNLGVASQTSTAKQAISFSALSPTDIDDRLKALIEMRAVVQRVKDFAKQHENAFGLIRGNIQQNKLDEAIELLNQYSRDYAPIEQDLAALRDKYRIWFPDIEAEILDTSQAGWAYAGTNRTGNLIDRINAWKSRPSAGEYIEASAAMRDWIEVWGTVNSWPNQALQGLAHLKNDYEARRQSLR